MNFPVLPTITEAIERRLREPHFGYFEPRQEYLDAIVAWQRDRNGVEDLSPSILATKTVCWVALSLPSRPFTAPGDAVLVHSPPI